MNKILAATIRVSNGIAAILLVIAGGVLGQIIIGQTIGYQLGIENGWFIGAIIGFFIAVGFCGYIAILNDMRSELIKIRAILEKPDQKTI